MTGTETQDEEKGGKQKGLDKLRKESLRAAGLSFLLADSSLIAFGHFSGEGGSKNMMAAGAFGITAGAIGTIFGHQKAERQLRELAQGLEEHLHKKGITIPTNINDPALTRKGGFLDKIASFMYGHPSQMMNVLYSMVGGAFIREGMQHNIRNLKISGCLLISGALGGILIREKKPDPNHPPEGLFQKIASWIQEKPLRITGTLFNLNQAFLGLSAFEYRKRNPKNKSYLLVLLAVAAFTFGNTMMALTSKSREGTSKIDTKTLDAIADTSARIIAAQPDRVRSAVLNDVSTYLASQENVSMSKEQINRMLSAKLAQAGRSPQAGNWQGRIANVPEPSLQPSR